MENKQFYKGDLSMEFSDLQIFLTVVRADGINRAAEVLHRAQSSVTSRIQVLEDKVGVQLFLREGRRLQLSPAGKILVGYAERIVELSREAASAVQATSRPACQASVRWRARRRPIPGPLGRFHDRYPDVALELYSGDPRGSGQQGSPSRTSMPH